MPYIPRGGRPGLLGLAARTAVVAGTANAVNARMAAHQQAETQQQFDAAQYAAQQGAASAPPPTDLVAELQSLSRLRTQGLLSDAEFDAAKAQLLR
ncbi:SHOCT domain-containing protein [Gordonia sp. PDNC005]|uniref:SHOCT domain-containing protein n=1 Tax=unclassified Gordonia (in: high G+C Gram-positive bacteria) TaxID=2657482 RepID=UPI0019668C53|nr:SHOCT domain-containing protein [Gordonia sp. PDNC005]QRY64219.1 SHOCT domain-containing protein [Gordonia sp. PDNC005]